MKEIWKDIKGYEGKYMVSNLGRVLSLPRKSKRGKSQTSVKGGIICPSLVGRKNNAYLSVTLRNGSSPKSFKVHRLVITAFVCNKEKKEQINHINGIKTDNRLENLEWCTRSENIQHAYKMGLINIEKRKNNNKTKKVLDTSSGKIFNSIKEAAEFLNIKHRTLHAWILGSRTNKSNMKYYD